MLFVESACLLDSQRIDRSRIHDKPDGVIPARHVLMCRCDHEVSTLCEMCKKPNNGVYLPWSRFMTGGAGRWIDGWNDDRSDDGQAHMLAEHRALIVLANTIERIQAMIRRFRNTRVSYCDDSTPWLEPVEEPPIISF